MVANSPASDVRSRMVHSAAELQRLTGVTGTGFADIIAHSKAPRGSIYYHFPEGRIQLAAEATQYAAEAMADDLRRLMSEAGDVHGALDAFIAMWLDIMRDNDFHTGCAVAAAALDSRSAPILRQAADEGFQLWERLLSAAFEYSGIEVAAAQALAVTVLAAVEGAIILSRAAGNGDALERVGVQLHRLIDLSLPS